MRVSLAWSSQRRQNSQPVLRWMCARVHRAQPVAQVGDCHDSRDLAVLNAVLHIFLTAIERVLRQHSPDASATSHLGPAIFIRPAVALERLREIDPEHLAYESVKPGPGGSLRR